MGGEKEEKDEEEASCFLCSSHLPFLKFSFKPTTFYYTHFDSKRLLFHFPFFSFYFRGWIISRSLTILFSLAHL